MSAGSASRDRRALGPPGLVVQRPERADLLAVGHEQEPPDLAIAAVGRLHRGLEDQPEILRRDGIGRNFRTDRCVNIASPIGIWRRLALIRRWPPRDGMVGRDLATRRWGEYTRTRMEGESARLARGRMPGSKERKASAPRPQSTVFVALVVRVSALVARFARLRPSCGRGTLRAFSIAAHDPLTPTTYRDRSMSGSATLGTNARVDPLDLGETIRAVASTLRAPPRRARRAEPAASARRRPPSGRSSSTTSSRSASSRGSSSRRRLRRRRIRARRASSRS